MADSYCNVNIYVQNQHNIQKYTVSAKNKFGLVRSESRITGMEQISIEAHHISEVFFIIGAYGVSACHQEGAATESAANLGYEPTSARCEWREITNPNLSNHSSSGPFFTLFIPI